MFKSYFAVITIVCSMLVIGGVNADKADAAPAVTVGQTTSGAGGIR